MTQDEKAGMCSHSYTQWPGFGCGPIFYAFLWEKLLQTAKLLSSSSEHNGDD